MGRKPDMPRGTMIGAFSLCMILVIGFGCDFYLGFDWAVSFGKTRKDFLYPVFCVYFFVGCFFAGILKLLLKAEIFIGKRLYGEGVLSAPKGSGLSLCWIPVCVLMLIALAGLAGMVIHKFRTRGAFTLVFLWFVFCFLIQKELIGLQHFIMKFRQLPVGLQQVSLLIPAFLIVIITGEIMKKEAVNA